MPHGQSDGGCTMIGTAPTSPAALTGYPLRLDVRANLLDSGWSMGISGTVKQ